MRLALLHSSGRNAQDNMSAFHKTGWHIYRAGRTAYPYQTKIILENWETLKWSTVKARQNVTGTNAATGPVSLSVRTTLASNPKHSKEATPKDDANVWTSTRETLVLISTDKNRRVPGDTIMPWSHGWVVTSYKCNGAWLFRGNYDFELLYFLTKCGLVG